MATRTNLMYPRSSSVRDKGRSFVNLIAPVGFVNDPDGFVWIAKGPTRRVIRIRSEAFDDYVYVIR